MSLTRHHSTSDPAQGKATITGVHAHSFMLLDKREKEKDWEVTKRSDAPGKPQEQGKALFPVCPVLSRFVLQIPVGMRHNGEDKKTKQLRKLTGNS